MKENMHACYCGKPRLKSQYFQWFGNLRGDPNLEFEKCRKKKLHYNTALKQLRGICPGTGQMRKSPVFAGISDTFIHTIKINKIYGGCAKTAAKKIFKKSEKKYSISKKSVVVYSSTLGESDARDL